MLLVRSRNVGCRGEADGRSWTAGSILLVRSRDCWADGCACWGSILFVRSRKADRGEVDGLPKSNTRAVGLLLGMRALGLRLRRRLPSLSRDPPRESLLPELLNGLPRCLSPASGDGGSDVTLCKTRPTRTMEDRAGRRWCEAASWPSDWGCAGEEIWFLGVSSREDPLCAAFSAC